MAFISSLPAEVLAQILDAHGTGDPWAILPSELLDFGAVVGIQHPRSGKRLPPWLGRTLLLWVACHAQGDVAYHCANCSSAAEGTGGVGFKWWFMEDLCFTCVKEETQVP